ncbi:unnamed protein product, partial [Hapterophycus canaliculatus]
TYTNAFQQTSEHQSKPQVNLAIIIDGSSSVNSTNFALSKEFAKDAVDAFADENLFVNGG